MSLSTSERFFIIDMSHKEEKETSTKNRDFPPGSSIIFLDKDYKQAPDETGCNQVGIYTTSNRIMFCRKKRIIEMDVNKLVSAKALVYRPKDKKLGAKIAASLNHNKGNYRHFIATFRAMKLENYKFFDSPNIMPKFKKWESVAEHKVAWNELLSKIQEADLVCTFNTKSVVSKFIAKLDGGSWSHSATYIGNNEITEAVAKGVIKTSIQKYNDTNFHVGVYRPVFMENAKAREVMIDFQKQNIGKRYNYLGAVKLGIRTLLGIDSKIPTPNGLIYTGIVYLIGYV